VIAMCSVTSIFYVAETLLLRHLYFSIAKVTFLCCCVWFCWWCVC